MNPYASPAVKEIPPYVDKSELGNLMVSGALAVLILCFAFTVLIQTLTLLGN